MKQTIKPLQTITSSLMKENLLVNIYERVNSSKYNSYVLVDKYGVIKDISILGMKFIGVCPDEYLTYNKNINKIIPGCLVDFNYRQVSLVSFTNYKNIPINCYLKVKTLFMTSSSKNEKGKFDNVQSHYYGYLVKMKSIETPRSYGIKKTNQETIKQANVDIWIKLGRNIVAESLNNEFRNVVVQQSIINNAYNQNIITKRLTNGKIYDMMAEELCEQHENKPSSIKSMGFQESENNEIKTFDETLKILFREKTLLGSIDKMYHSSKTDPSRFYLYLWFISVVISTLMIFWFQSVYISYIDSIINFITQMFILSMNSIISIAKCQEMIINKNNTEVMAVLIPEIQYLLTCIQLNIAAVSVNDDLESVYPLLQHTNSDESVYLPVDFNGKYLLDYNWRKFAIISDVVGNPFAVFSGPTNNVDSRSMVVFIDALSENFNFINIESFDYVSVR